MYRSALARLRAPRCDKGYVLLKDEEGRFSRCPAKDGNEHSFCICNGLMSSGGIGTHREEPLYTAGSNAWRIDRILPVSRLMKELAEAT
jgi:nitronate monooxygenase